MKFTQDVKIRTTRANGMPGWKLCLKGSSPEDNGLTPEEIEANMHMLEKDEKKPASQPAASTKKTKKEGK